MKKVLKKLSNIYKKYVNLMAALNLFQILASESKELHNRKFHDNCKHRSPETIS